MLVAVALAFLEPRVFSWVEPYMVYLLGALMFFGSLKVNFGQIAGYLKRPGYVFGVALAAIVIFPVLTFWVTRAILPAYAVGFFFLAAAPSAMASAAVARILKGEVSLALVFSVTQHLLTPFTLTFLTYILVGQTIEIDLLNLFLYLVAVIFIPLGLVFLSKKFWPKLVDKGGEYAGGLANIMIFILVATPLAIRRTEIVEIVMSAWWVVAAVLIFGVIRHVIGFWLVPKAPIKERIATVLPFAYVNTILVLVLAIKFFDAATVLILVLDELVFGLGLIVFKYFLKKRYGI